jgi:CheY-like chemotaxis protein
MCEAVYKPINQNLIVEKRTALHSKTVLLVDDNDDSRILTKWFLDNVGYAVDSAQSAEEALSRFNAKIHDLVLTDNSMPGMTGAELAHIIKLRSPTTPVLMYSGNPPQDRSCIDVVVPKPAHLIDLKETVDKLLAIE